MMEKVGDIVEHATGPYRCTTVFYHGIDSGLAKQLGCYASYEPVEGPPTKKQQEHRDYRIKQDERQIAKAIALRRRIEAALSKKLEYELIDKELIDLIVDLIHEESEY